ncbi:Uncharacterised protein at_DN2218 [Pycnogonum litorale]
MADLRLTKTAMTSGKRIELSCRCHRVKKILFIIENLVANNIEPSKFQTFLRVIARSETPSPRCSCYVEYVHPFGLVSQQDSQVRYHEVFKSWTFSDVAIHGTCGGFSQWTDVSCPL